MLTNEEGVQVHKKKENRLNINMTINGQIVFSFTALLVMFILSIVLVIILLFSSRLIRQETEIMQRTIESVSDGIDNNINQLRKLAIALRQDDRVMDVLQSGKMTDQVRKKMDSMYTYGLQNSVLITNDDIPLNTPFSAEKNASEMLHMVGYFDYRKKGFEERFSTPHLYPYPTSLSVSNNTKISYFFTMREQDEMQRYGSVLFILNKDSLFTNGRRPGTSQFDHYYVIDGIGSVIYSSTGYETCETMERAKQLVAGRYNSFNTTYGSNSYFHYVVPNYPDWHIVGVASIHTIKTNARLLTMYVLILGLFGVILVVVLSNIISRRITGPFKQMGEAMKEFEAGRIPEKLKVDRNGEIGELQLGFNNMIDNIETNINTLLKEQEEKRNAKVTAIQYQLQSLQQQINPHFLYNTMNVINYLAMQQKTEEIVLFVHSLNQLLRATLSNSKDTVTLKEELTLIQAYSQLMEYRYKDMFTLEIEVEEDAYNCIVPKLILQPIVENALLHGIFPSGRKGRITIRACCLMEQLFVSVNDDGVGIPEEKLFTLLEEKRGFSSVGLINVNDRIKLCYSGNKGLEISSKSNVGTIVGFSVPIQREETCIET